MNLLDWLKTFGACLVFLMIGVVIPAGWVWWHR